MNPALIESILNAELAPEWQHRQLGSRADSHGLYRPGTSRRSDRRSGGRDQGSISRGCLSNRGRPFQRRTVDDVSETGGIGNPAKTDIGAIALATSARIRDEIDYASEAKTLAILLELYRDHPFIRIPDVVSEAAAPGC